MQTDEFTIEKAIEYQTEQLQQWKRILIDSVYRDLEQWAKANNETVTNPYHIRRGTDFDQFVFNHPIYKGKQQ